VARGVLGCGRGHPAAGGGGGVGCRGGPSKGGGAGSGSSVKIRARDRNWSGGVGEAVGLRFGEVGRQNAPRVLPLKEETGLLMCT